MKRILMQVLTILVGAFFVVGCSKDDNKEWWEEYEKKNDDLNILFGTQYAGNYGENVVLAGTLGGKLWVGEYDHKSKNKIFEWCDSDSLMTQISVYKEYGEYDNYRFRTINVLIEHIESHVFIKIDHEYVPDSCCGTSWYRSEVIAFYENKFAKKHNDLEIRSNETISGIRTIPWYAGSYIIIRRRDASDNNDSNSSYAKCFSRDGEKLFDLHLYSDNLLPVSFEEGIIVDYNTAIRYNIKTGEKIWENVVYDNIDSNAKTTLVRTNVNENIWSYSLDIVNYDGTKETRNFKINIDTGVIIK